MLRGMWDLPEPGLEPVSPALAGGFLTIASEAVSNLNSQMRRGAYPGKQAGSCQGRRQAERRAAIRTQSTVCGPLGQPCTLGLDIITARCVPQQRMLVIMGFCYQKQKSNQTNQNSSQNQNNHTQCNLLEETKTLKSIYYI